MSRPVVAIPQLTTTATTTTTTTTTTLATTTTTTYYYYYYYKGKVSQSRECVHENIAGLTEVINPSLFSRTSKSIGHPRNPLRGKQPYNVIRCKRVFPPQRGGEWRENRFKTPIIIRTHSSPRSGNGRVG